MGPTGCPATSVTNYQSTLRKIPQKRMPHLQCGGSLKSRITGHMGNCLKILDFICRPILSLILFRMFPSKTLQTVIVSTPRFSCVQVTELLKSSLFNCHNISQWNNLSGKIRVPVWVNNWRHKKICAHSNTALTQNRISHACQKFNTDTKNKHY